LKRKAVLGLADFHFVQFHNFLFRAAAVNRRKLREARRRRSRKKFLYLTPSPITIYVSQFAIPA
jgi:hypothetical protein